MTCTGCNKSYAPHELVNGLCVRCWHERWEILAETARGVIASLQAQIQNLQFEAKIRDADKVKA